MKNLLLTFIVTWTMKSGIYCGQDNKCLQALSGNRTASFEVYQDAKNLACQLGDQAQGVTINGIPSEDICKPQPVCEPCKSPFGISY